MVGATARSSPMSDWARTHRQGYLTSGGAEGHIVDLTRFGGGPFSTNCLIRYKGRTSGRTFINGLCYGMVAGEIVVAGSKGGSPEHPSWYLNLTSREEVDVQIGTQAFRATWRLPEGEEREKMWDYMVQSFPFYARYQTLTERTIPLVAMCATSALPVFSLSDIDG